MSQTLVGIVGFVVGCGVIFAIFGGLLRAIRGKAPEVTGTFNGPSRIVAGLLAIFLGVFGVHLFYMKRYNVAIAWLIAAIVLSWTVVVPLALGLVSFFQGIGYLLSWEATWRARFNNT